MGVLDWIKQQAEQKAQSSPTLASWLGSAGKAIDTYGRTADENRFVAPLGAAIGDIAKGITGGGLSEWLESIGGNYAYAAEPYTPPPPPERLPDTSYIGDWQSQVTPPNTNTDTGSGGVITSGTSGTVDSLGQNQFDLAEWERQSRLNSILANLSLMRQQADYLIGRAGGVRDEVLGNIASTYGGLRGQAETSRDTSLANLAQEDINIQNLYGRAQGAARRALESALTKNRMRARAMNRLNSSFYDDIQAEATEGGRRSVADLMSEEAGKRQAIDTRKTETKNWFEQQLTNIGSEEARLKSQAEREYQDAVNQAAYMEQAYGIDSVEQAEEAERVFRSRLDSINEYINNKAWDTLLGNNARTISSTLSSYQPINPALQSVLSNTQGLNKAQSYTQNVPTFGSVNQGDKTNLLAYFQQLSPEEQKEYLARYGYNIS
jgi:hypothetical protein